MTESTQKQITTGDETHEKEKRRILLEIKKSSINFKIKKNLSCLQIPVEHRLACKLK